MTRFDDETSFMSSGTDTSTIQSREELHKKIPKHLLPKFIFNLPPAQLIQFWSRLYKGTNTEFCHEYELSELALHKMTTPVNTSPPSSSFSIFDYYNHHPKVSVPCLLAMRSYLLDVKSRDELKSFYLSTVNEMVDCVTHRCTTTTSVASMDATHTDNHFTEQQTCTSSVIKGIVFIDGDNSSHCLDDLKSEKKENELPLVKHAEDYHFVIVMSKGVFSKSLIGFECRSWASILESFNNVKSAVDVALQTCIVTLHLKLQEFPQIPFYIATSDQFGIEIVDQIQNLGNLKRQVFRIDTSSTKLAHYLSSEVQKVQGEERCHHDHHHHQQEIMDTITKRLSSIAIRDYESSQSNSNEREKIATHLPPRSREFATAATTTATTTAIDQELIDFYHSNWKGTHAAFCRAYGFIDPSNFSRWRRGNGNYKSRASTLAVLQYRHDIESETKLQQ